MLILLPLLAIAANPAEEPALDCENAITQQDMNRCAHLDYEEADRALNAQWAETSAVMKKWDAEYMELIRDGRPGFYQALLEAQRAWLAFRDAHCLSEGFGARGGSLEPLLVSTCKTRMTKQRTEELRELISYVE